MEKEINKTHIFCDSQIVIKWILRINKIHSLQFIPLLGEIQKLNYRLECVEFKYIYREKNCGADEMGKHGVKSDLNISMIHSSLRM